MSLRARSSGLRAGRRSRRGDAMVELTPLIDIVFQLLIFFLLTATFQNNPSFKVKLPKAKNRDTTTEPKAVVVTISDNGVLEVDRLAVDHDELQKRLCKAAAEDGTTGVNIRSDEAAATKYLVGVMDVAKQCGLEKLGILHGQ